MADYTTDLTEWGASGQEYPLGYKYEDGTAPVDDWDNFLMDNIIKDITTLIETTNSRIESGYGTTFPTTTGAAHLFTDTGEGSLYWYDLPSDSWSEALDKNGDTMHGVLDATAGIELGSDLNNSGTTIYNSSESLINVDVIPKQNLDAKTADTADVALNIESRTDYPSNPTGGRVVYRSDK
jgi:hypothetical protein